MCETPLTFPAASLAFPEFLFILLGNQAGFPEARVPLPAPDPAVSSRKASGTLCILPGHTHCHFFMAHVSLRRQRRRQASSAFWFCLNYLCWRTKFPGLKSKGQVGLCNTFSLQITLWYWSTNAVNHEVQLEKVAARRSCHQWWC